MLFSKVFKGIFLLIDMKKWLVFIISFFLLILLTSGFLIKKDILQVERFFNNQELGTQLSGIEEIDRTIGFIGCSNTRETV